MSDMTPIDFIASEIARCVTSTGGGPPYEIVRKQSRAVLTEWFARVGKHTYPSRHGPDSSPFAVHAWASGSS